MICQLLPLALRFGRRHLCVFQCIHSLDGVRRHIRSFIHDHNIYIDSILSYGVVGTVVLLAYTFVLNKEIFTSHTRKENPALFGMMMCFIAIVLIYGLLDCTLNIVATGTLCFIILNSACMYLEK